MGRRERRKWRWLASGDEKGLLQVSSGYDTSPRQDITFIHPSYMFNTAKLEPERPGMRPDRHQSMPVKSYSHPPHLHTYTKQHAQLKGEGRTLRIRKKFIILETS